MKNIALIIAYDGSHFYGWQNTASGASIEHLLGSALMKILQHPISLQAASRTDRGVHAEGQCVNFLTEKEFPLLQLHKSLNGLLPPSIRILKVAQMPIEFHPTLHAEKKEYHYDLNLGPLQLPKERFFAWHIPYPLNLVNMRESCSYFVGLHDFSSFCNQRKNLNYHSKKRSILSLEIEEIDPTHLKFKIQGTHFLYKMVRNIVGTLVYIGLEKMTPQEIPQLLLHPCRAKAGITAPAHGLTLKKIDYPRHFLTLCDIVDPIKSG